MSAEEWRKTKTLPPSIEVSSEGRVRRYVNGVDTQIVTPKVYNGVLSINYMGTTVQIHRLIAEAFVPNPKGLRTVKHLNGDKSDNRAENLEWAEFIDNFKKEAHKPAIYCKERDEVYATLRTAFYITGVGVEFIKQSTADGKQYGGLTFEDISRDVEKYADYSVLYVDFETAATFMRAAQSPSELQSRTAELIK